MKTEIEVKEYSPASWKLICISSCLLALILFLVYWNTTNVFWGGILRLAAFVCFATAVLSGLKAMDGLLRVNIGDFDNNLILTYFKKNRTVHEEVHKHGDIKEVACIPFSSLIAKNSGYMFLVRFNDSKQDYELFHFSGRTLKFDRENAERILTFLKEKKVPVKNHKSNIIT
jgi:hypothetical protein